MGKIIALFALLVVANVAFLAWVYLSRRKGDNTGSNGTGNRDSSNKPNPASPVTGPNAKDGTGSGVVVYHDSATDKPVKDQSNLEPCGTTSTAPVVGARPDGPFLVPPIVQIGSDPNRLDCVEIIFFTPAEIHGLKLAAFSDRTLAVSELKQSTVCVEGVVPHRRYSCTVSGLKPGERFKYWVTFGNKVVFEAYSAARKGRGVPHRFVVVGDMGNGSVESTIIAHRIYTDYKPDLLAITGDVVYRHGRASEYLRRFLPVYNARVNESGVGAPLLAEVLSFTSLGNHCVGKMEYFVTPTFDEFPDLHGFFLYWALPLNGPLTDAEAEINIPELRGDQERIARFRRSAGERFPQMGNYSFDDGDAHWLVLDANAYMDWTDARLRAWVENDLIAARDAKWKFVNFHQPGFSSNPKHGIEKRMRLLTDIFEKHGVDIVFNGHCHYYERSFPLRFTVQANADGSLIDKDGQVAGDFVLDKTFDGVNVTKPNGIIYITTGAGGAKLDPSGIHWRPEEWKPFTHKLVGDRHSFTVADLDGNTLTLRQIDQSGKEIDKLVVTK
jgi:acid phosphatase type 7